jgi:hypothetical protein
MPSALSIADAVDRRGCDFTGCETCPFRVYAQRSYACMFGGGVTALLALPLVARLLGQDEERIRELIDTDLERALDLQRHTYSVANVEQTKELARRLDEALRGLEGVVEGPFDEVRPEWLERVRADLWTQIEELPDLEGRVWPRLSSMRVMLEIAASFLATAVKMGAEVEFDRYDIPMNPE